MLSSKVPHMTKGLTPDLKNNCFLTLEDSPSSRQDDFKTLLKAIGGCSSRALEYSQSLLPSLYRLEF